MTGLKYIGIALILAVVAAFIALDFDPFGENGPGLTLFSTANMCTDPELKEYVFWPFSCDEFNQIKVVDFGGSGPISSRDKIHELNRNTDIVHIGQ
ncbi:hypothetical protein [Yoonia sp. BS5-3]|uniref:Uncharacterized protein n=1 Tax=Yoonia phaeophyticola TaxID=3137369 RepID=A0ABZ2V963_9RHOB